METAVVDHRRGKRDFERLQLQTLAARCFMTERFFRERWLGLLAAYPNAGNVTNETQRMFWEMLKDLSEDKFDHAVRQCINQCKYFPTVAEIRQHLPVKKVEPFKQLPPPEEVDLEKGRAFLDEIIGKLCGRPESVDADTIARREERKALIAQQARMMNGKS